MPKHAVYSWHAILRGGNLSVTTSVYSTGKVYDLRLPFRVIDRQIGCYVCGRKRSAAARFRRPCDVVDAYVDALKRTSYSRDENILVGSKLQSRKRWAVAILVSLCVIAGFFMAGKLYSFSSKYADCMANLRTVRRLIHIVLHLFCVFMLYASIYWRINPKTRIKFHI